MKSFKAVILGSDENAYGCAESLYEIGKEKPLVLCARALLATDGSGLLTRRVISDLDSPSVFSKVLLELLPRLKQEYERVLVIPCSDYYAELLINNRPMLSEWIDSPINLQSVYSRFSTKGAFAYLCREYGISHPKTEIALPNAFLAQEKERKYPLVLKPANSNSSDYLHSTVRDRKKAYICQNEDELRVALTSFLLDGYVKNVAVQEYLCGEERTSAVINAYCDKDSNVRVIGVARPLLEYKNPRDIGNYAALTAFSDRKLCDEAAELLQRIGYVGFANFDLKFDESSGRYAFLELNPRQGRSSYWMKCAGGDLMLAMYEDVVLKKPYTGRMYAEEPCLWVNEPMCVIKREMKRRGLEMPPEISKLSAESAFSFKADPSFQRAVTLTKRYLSAFSKEL